MRQSMLVAVAALSLIAGVSAGATSAMADYARPATKKYVVAKPATAGPHIDEWKSDLWDSSIP